MPDLRISIIINTDGRAKALRDTIESFRHLDYPSFEVCVVYGPTEDGTKAYVQSLAGRVKFASCPVRNLSQSRNIGIAIASGELVAFIDDDGIAEAEWLSDLVVPFKADPRVGGAGGVVYDHTGYRFQYLYAACDRLGNATLDLKEPLSENSYPLASVFPYVQGTNSAFRRRSLIEIGGFDEEYEFYLDETDVCCRLVDHGLKIAQLPNARVHHKFLPSHIRNEDRITVKKYAVLKNKIYFSLVSNRGHVSMNEVIADNFRFMKAQRDDLQMHVDGGRISAAEIDVFEADVERAWKVGLSRGLSEVRRTRPSDYFGEGEPFLPYETVKPQNGKRTFVFLSQSYPPDIRGGNARHTHDIAQALGAEGHKVHVLTKGNDFSRVDLEGDVWVHRIVPKLQLPRPVLDGGIVPERVWNHSKSMLEEIYRINRSRPVDVVEAVSWDCEGAATVFDGRFPSAVNIVTSFASWLDTHSEERADESWMADFGRPMLDLERTVVERSPGIIAATKAITHAVQEDYGISFQRDRVAYCPHGLRDMEPLRRRKPRTMNEAADRRAILFVGRLELRKGIDTLLATVPRLLDRYNDLDLWIAGDDRLLVDGGKTVRAAFEASAEGRRHAGRVKFLGVVEDEELRWLYANCCVFAAPSRFESFGLIFVEAMMFGKPVVGCSVGGVGEVVDHDRTGLLTPAGDAVKLGEALDMLLRDEGRRQSLGAAGRRAYEERFAATIVAKHRRTALERLMRTPLEERQIRREGGFKEVGIGFNESGVSLDPKAKMVAACTRSFAYITFWGHPHSGIAEVWTGGVRKAEIDLFDPVGMMTTLRVALPESGGELEIRRTGKRSSRAEGSEVIVFHIAEATT